MITFSKLTREHYHVFYDGIKLGEIRYEDGELLFVSDQDEAFDAAMMRSIADALDAINAHREPKNDE